MAHFLNLIWTNGGSYPETIFFFFDVLQNKMYTFFSISKHKWEVLNASVKNLVERRWSVWNDPNKALYKNWFKIKALKVISLDNSEKPNIHCKASEPLKNIKLFKTLFLSIF